MNFEPALAKRLLNDPAVAAKVGTRIDWDRLTQGAPLDAIVLETVADVRPQHFGGFQKVRGTPVLIHCWSKTKAGAVALRNAVLAAVVPAALVDGVRFQRAQDVGATPTYERTATDERYREIIQITLWHNGQ